ncbi:hypothetical protein BDV28DRAFT_132758 [Aspergillus coremiiformis]|uniref:Uncharacterized protein n=1 Tax=Aspergillus coremiiformis TaxID=138285 RepID=A0A5N6Z7K0_9EURO|nr:hypothetical protein BDV28DRAFT_132758 [Aspergillus coremiiformis]
MMRDQSDKREVLETRSLLLLDWNVPAVFVLYILSHVVISVPCVSFLVDMSIVVTKKKYMHLAVRSTDV